MTIEPTTMEAIIASVLDEHTSSTVESCLERPEGGYDWFDQITCSCGAYPVSEEDLSVHRSRAILKKLAEIGNVEWGVAWHGINVDPMKSVSLIAAKATADLISSISSDGDPAFPITRVVANWERVE